MNHINSYHINSSSYHMMMIDELNYPIESHIFHNEHYGGVANLCQTILVWCKFGGHFANMSIKLNHNCIYTKRK